MSARTDPSLLTGGRPFAFTALAGDGQVVRGRHWAADEDEVRARLRARGLWALAVAPDRPDGTPFAPAALADLAVGLRILGTLVEAGLPLDRALGAFARAAPARWSGAPMDALLAAVHEGRGLSAALVESGLGPPEYVVGMLQAGEANGLLAPSLLESAAELEVRLTTIRAVRSALAYPAMLALTGTLAMIILVGIVLPRFAAIVADLGQPLPWLARMLLVGGAGILHVAVPVLLVLVVAAWLAASGRRPEGLRAEVGSLLRRLPVVGEIRRLFTSARIGSLLAALLQSGLPIVPALAVAGRAAGGQEDVARLDRTRERVLRGAPLSDALAAEDAVSPSAAHLVRAGEAAGTVVPMLRYAARLDREQAERRLAGLVQMLEPTLILVFAVAVAAVAGTLLQVIYSVRPVP